MDTMKKFLPLLIMLAVCAGCRRDYKEPANWNPEKALGRRNRGAPQIAWVTEIVTNSLDDVVTVTTNTTEIVEASPQPFQPTLTSIARESAVLATTAANTPAPAPRVRGSTTMWRIQTPQRNTQLVRPQAPVSTGFRRVTKPLLIDDEEP